MVSLFAHFFPKLGRSLPSQLTRAAHTASIKSSARSIGQQRRRLRERKAKVRNVANIYAVSHPLHVLQELGRSLPTDWEPRNNVQV